MIYQPPRRRGAQSGNTNSLKHGFYAEKLRQTTVNSNQNMVSDLSPEIHFLRRIIQGIVDINDQEHDLNRKLALLHGLSNSLLSLARLIRTQHFLETHSIENKDSLHDFFNMALQELESEGFIPSSSPDTSPPL